MSTPQTLNIPLIEPRGLEGVAVRIPPEAPCTIEASIADETLGFARDSSVLSPAGRALLQTFVTAILRNARHLEQIDLAGFASAEGEVSYNLPLSQSRADAVGTVLASIPELHQLPIRAVGMGEKDPVGDNGTEDGREANRRVELSFHFTGCANR